VPLAATGDGGHLVVRWALTRETDRERILEGNFLFNAALL